VPDEIGLPPTCAVDKPQHSIGKTARITRRSRCLDRDAVKTVTVVFPVDTIASARGALERGGLVFAGVLDALDAGVAKYGEAETLRGIAQLLTAFAASLVRNWYFFLPVAASHTHSWGYLGPCHVAELICPGLV
jgi:hypothetical protein